MNVFDGPLPFDAQAEESVVASLMVDQGAINNVAPILEPRDFHAESPRWTYEACLALHGRGESVNQVTVAHELDRRGHLQDVGGLSYISDLVLNLPTPIGVESYARIVHADAGRRRVISEALRLAQAAFQRSDIGIGVALARIESLAMQVGPRLGLATRIKPGGSAILDLTTADDPSWGSIDTEIVAMKGEPFFLYGPTGVGKSSIGQQLILCSIGLRDDLLGLPVTQIRRWLYLALDRPPQIKHSLRRMVREEDRGILDDRLSFHDGPLDFDLALEPAQLLALAKEVGAGAVMIDGLKDAASDIEKTAGGQGINRALQLLVSNGIQVVVQHHPRKAQVGNAKPKKIDDVYGSRFIVDGAGAVVLIWGEPGDSVVELTHLKQPRDSVGPWILVHDHERGITTRQDNVDAYTLIAKSNGISAEGIARQLFKTDKPTDAQLANARRKAKAVVTRGFAYERPGTTGGAGGGTPALFFKLSPTNSTDATDAPLTRQTTPPSNGRFPDSTVTDETTDATDATTDDSGCLYRETPDVVAGVDLEPCRGLCAAMVQPGRMCFNCATAQVRPSFNGARL